MMYREARSSAVPVDASVPEEFVVRTAWMTLVRMLVATLALGSALQAQQPPDVWVRSMDVGLTRARFSGAAAVVVFSADWCGYCEKLENFFFAPRVRPVSDKTVLILVDIANPEASRRFRIEGHHQAVVLAWDGAELARLKLDDNLDVPLAAFRRAVCANEMDAADVLVKVERLAKAAERAEGVLALDKVGPQADRARKMLDGILVKAREELAKARELLKTGRVAECAQACDTLAESFPPNMVSAEVSKLRKDIDRVRKGSPLLEPPPVERPEIVVAKRAQDLVDRAMVAEWDRQYTRATQLYEQAVRDFPAEKSTDDARARLKSLRENPETANLIKQQEIDLQCRRLIQMARAYVLSGRPAQARDYYERIVREYPQTAWARTAKNELEKLKD